MRARLMGFVIAWAMLGSPALGQTVFFDDFDGDALLPHWNGQPPREWWDYNVSNSMLNVTGLFNPSHPKFPTNSAILGAYGAYSPQTDFQLDATMGWGASEGVARFELTVMINQGLVASIGYREHAIGLEPGIFAAIGANTLTIPAPEPGMYDFRITRTGSLYNFYFDGSLFASLTSPYTGPVDGLQFLFSSPYPGPSGPFHIDWVQVQIPSPGTFIALAAGLACVSRRSK